MPGAARAPWKRRGPIPFRRQHLSCQRVGLASPRAGRSRGGLLMPRRLRLRSRRAQLSALVLVLALAGGVFAFLKHRGRDKGVTVQTEEVRRGEVVEMVAATGRVQPQTEVKISANVSGRIDKLGV